VDGGMVVMNVYFRRLSNLDSPGESQIVAQPGGAQDPLRQRNFTHAENEVFNNVVEEDRLRRGATSGFSPDG
jgi:hypothetical protein